MTHVNSGHSICKSGNKLYSYEQLPLEAFPKCLSSDAQLLECPFIERVHCAVSFQTGLKCRSDDLLAPSSANPALLYREKIALGSGISCIKSNLISAESKRTALWLLRQKAFFHSRWTSYRRSLHVPCFRYQECVGPTFPLLQRRHTSISTSRHCKRLRAQGDCPYSEVEKIRS